MIPVFGVYPYLQLRDYFIEIQRGPGTNDISIKRNVKSTACIKTKQKKPSTFHDVLAYSIDHWEWVGRVARGTVSPLLLRRWRVGGGGDVFSSLLSIAYGLPNSFRPGRLLYFFDSHRVVSFVAGGGRGWSSRASFKTLFD